MNVGSRQSLERVTKYRDYYKIGYTVLFDQQVEVTRSYNVRGIPLFVMLDEKGVITYRNYVMPQKYLEMIE